MGEMTVLRGKKNYKDVGHVIQFNGEDGNALWNMIWNQFNHKFVRI